MADHFRFAEAWQADDSLAPCPAQPRIGDFHIGQVHAGGAMAKFEDQGFFMVKAAVAGNGGDAGRKGFAGTAGTALAVHAHVRTSFWSLWLTPTLLSAPW